MTTEFGSAFARHLCAALVRAGWQRYQGDGCGPRWSHDASGCVVELDVGRGFAVWLCCPGEPRPRPVGSQKRDAERAAMDVAEQCWEQAARLSMQVAPPDAP